MLLKLDVQGADILHIQLRVYVLDTLAFVS